MEDIRVSTFTWSTLYSSSYSTVQHYYTTVYHILYTHHIPANSSTGKVRQLLLLFPAVLSAEEGPANLTLIFRTPPRAKLRLGYHTYLLTIIIVTYPLSFYGTISGNTKVPKSENIRKVYTVVATRR